MRMCELASRKYQHNSSLGAGEPCQLGAEPYLAQVNLDWFQDVLDKKLG